ncbi:formate dehydrogenase accessory sulfurtransferase FdhD [Sphingomonas sp. LT1P40]|uniref:formate dehydrogenase accessory sulfurtransferase FdhD n=1 Tax=Alteristakelama amylovorans TaxID=3096166 RepID=UPI002FC59122
MTSASAFAVRRVGFDGSGDAGLMRDVPIEAPVAIEYNGIGYAVMMATPADLQAYVVGLTLAEGIARADEIEAVDIHAIDGGWIVRVTLPTARMEPVLARARTRVSESSCGLCGIESIEQVLRPLPPVTARIATSRDAIARALAALPNHQPLSRATGAVHAAAFCTPDGAIVAAREDVGRHNALDKLIGTLALDDVDPATGFILLSARCSYELVEKTVRAGCPMLVTISAPTSLAVERATAAGLTLVALARADTALVLNDPWGSIA